MKHVKTIITDNREEYWRKLCERSPLQAAGKLFRAIDKLEKVKPKWYKQNGGK